MRPDGGQRAVDTRDVVVEGDTGRREEAAAGGDFQFVVVRGRPTVFAVRLDHRERHPTVLHLAIRPAQCAEQVGPTNLEPDEIIGVVRHAHLIGFGVAHT